MRKIQALADLPIRQRTRSHLRDLKRNPTRVKAIRDRYWTARSVGLGQLAAGPPLLDNRFPELTPYPPDASRLAPSAPARSSRAERPAGAFDGYRQQRRRPVRL
jgi:hypothetical protein